MSNPRCCCHCDRLSVSRSRFRAVAVQQNAFSLDGFGQARLAADAEAWYH